MTIYTVHGYERIFVWMRVEADSPEEAVEKAKRGDYDDADSDPDRKLFKPAWPATEGWAFGKSGRARFK
jgi:hypothetical protein